MLLKEVKVPSSLSCSVWVSLGCPFPPDPVVPTASRAPAAHLPSLVGLELSYTLVLGREMGVEVPADPGSWCVRGFSPSLW